MGDSDLKVLVFVVILSRNIFHPQPERERRVQRQRRRGGASVGGGRQRQRPHPRDKVSLINYITT